MSTSMYSISVPVYVRYLGNLMKLLDKAEAHCVEKKIDPAALLSDRLYPDMFAFTRQVQIACDFAKGSSARLAGVDIPKYDDTEASFAELRARAQKTLDFIVSLPEDSFADAATRDITLTMNGEPVKFVGQPYFTMFALPNFYFHFTTAYDILRHRGVPLSKTDFVGGR